MVINLDNHIVIQDDNTVFLKLIGDIFDALDLPNEFGFIQKISDLIAKYTKARQVCIYISDLNTTLFFKAGVSSGRDMFPESVQPDDVDKIILDKRWNPGKGARLNLYKAARQAGFLDLATYPITVNRQIIGVLAAGFQEQMIEESMEILKRISLILGNFIDQNRHNNAIYSQLNELRGQEHLLKCIIGNTQEGVIILDRDFTVLDMNTLAEVILGYSSTEVIGQPVENLLIGPSGLMDALVNTLNGLATHDLGSVSLHRRNGQSFPSIIRVFPIVNDESIDGIVILFTDISEDEKIKLHTQHLEQRAVLGEVTAVFAHEVRNPINNIATGLQLLGTLQEPDDSKQELISRMLGDCNRLNHLMESVLAFSRPIETRFEKIDLPSLLQKILDRWRPRFSKLNIIPFIKRPDESREIMGDPRALEQVFTNLISNSVEAMSVNGGTLGIQIISDESTPARPKMIVELSDTGPGIPPEMRDRIFEPFVTASPRGTGLGLAITKRIVTAHRGTVILDTFPGGTIFKVSFPAEIGD